MVPKARIAELFGVSPQAVSQWVLREERKADRLEAARARSEGHGAVRHVTPAGGTAVFREPGGEPVVGAEVPPAAGHSRKRGLAS
jgi:hypothetical protein